MTFETWVFAGEKLKALVIFFCQYMIIGWFQNWFRDNKDFLNPFKVDHVQVPGHNVHQYLYLLHVFICSFPHKYLNKKKISNYLFIYVYLFLFIKFFFTHFREVTFWECGISSIFWIFGFEKLVTLIII